MKYLYALPLRAVLLPLLLFLLQIPAFSQTDTAIGRTTPAGAGGNYKKLAHALCDDLPADHEKVNAIYNWITHHIRYDVKAMQQGRLREEKPGKVFKERKGMCAGYSLLFAAMCREVGLKAVVVDGYAKDWMFDDGDKLYIPRHAWNAVYIDNRWRLVDATWGAGTLTQAPGWLRRQVGKAAKDPLLATGKLRFRYHYDSSFFLADPLLFRLRHLPSDPLWQLTDTCMPLQVYEAGERAIRDFNTRYPVLVENLPELDRMAAMEERPRIQAAAARIAAYNPRYHVINAAKQQADAADTLYACMQGQKQEGAAMAVLQQLLKHAQQEVGAQKMAIMAEYTVLKAKNKTKNRLAEQYVRRVRNDNRRMIAQCGSYIRNAAARTHAIELNAAAAARAGRAQRDKPAAKHTVVNPDAAALKILTDSIQQRSLRIQQIAGEIAQQEQLVSTLKKDNDARLDSLAAIFRLADSALTQETIARIRMYDSYDDEVQQWSRIVTTVRLQQVDSLQRHYFSGYDAVLHGYEDLRRLQWTQSELYRKNARDIEQYQRRSGYHKEFATAQDAGKDTCMQRYYRTLGNSISYIEGNKKLFAQLIRLYQRQEKLAGYMERSEKKRKELEEKNLAQKEAFDRKENDKQKRQLKATCRKAEQLVTHR